MNDLPMQDDLPSSPGPSRRELFAALAVAGISSEVFQRAVAAQAEKAVPITPEVIKEAEWIAGLKLSEADRKAVARTVQFWQNGQHRLRAVKVANSVPFPLVFNPAAELPPGQKTGTVEISDKAVPKKPASEDELAFLSVSSLAGLVRTRKISSVELTKLYLQRLKEYDPALSCVVTLTENTALAQAKAADAEIARGNYRGPLHGIPWGAKDLDLLSWLPDYLGSGGVSRAEARRQGNGGEETRGGGGGAGGQAVAGGACSER